MGTLFHICIFTSFSRKDKMVIGLNDLVCLKSPLGCGIKSIMTLLLTTELYPEARLALIILQNIGVVMVLPCCESAGIISVDASAL